MTGKIFVNLHIVVCSILLYSAISGCTVNPNGELDGNGSTSYDGNTSTAQKSFIAIPNTYKYGLPYAPCRMNDTELLAEYNSWKNQYVVSSGCPAGALRVRRDSTSQDDTVSEGIGYGMLLSFYFNDKTTFDGLYKYALAHMTDRGLMHWRVRADGVNISEFNIPTPHEIPWTNTNTGGPIVTQSTTPSGTGWVKMAENGRKLTSATDADEDMALALCMAAKVWGSSANFNYLTEAKKMISNIMTYDMHPGWGNPVNAYSPALGAGYYTGGTWGGINPGEKPGWNPSYYTPAYYPIFYEVSGDSSWLQLTNTMWQHMDIVGQANNGTGLFPDWCDTSTLICKPTYGCSDILPYKTQSYNFYYDSVRVPWRMAVAASWFNDQKALRIAKQNAEFFKTPFYSSNIVDGYAIDGSPWNPDNRDPLNTGVGGVNKMGAVYVSMIGCATLPYEDIYYANRFYEVIKNSKISYSDPWGHYYGNTLRLLALLYLNGEFVNYYDANNYTIITINPVPGTINAEDYIATNGVNKLTNLGGIAAISANSGIISYAISNTYSAIQYGLYRVIYTIYRYGTYSSPGPQYGGDSVLLYIDNMNQQETRSYWPLDTWVTVTNFMLMTPGSHTLSIANNAYNPFGVGSIKVEYLGTPPISPISSLNLLNCATTNGIYTLKSDYIGFSLYYKQGYYVTYLVNVPGVPGGTAKNYTVSFQGYYFGYANSATFSFWTNMSEPYTSATISYATSPVPSPGTGTVSLKPGLQVLMISGAASGISNLIIY